MQQCAVVDIGGLK